MNTLLRRIDVVREQSRDPQQFYIEEDESADEFIRLKKQIDRDLKDVRQVPIFS